MKQLDFGITVLGLGAAVAVAFGFPDPCNNMGLAINYPSSKQCVNTATPCANVPTCQAVGDCSYCSGADQALMEMDCVNGLHACTEIPNCAGPGGCGNWKTGRCENHGTVEDPDWQCVHTGTTTQQCVRTYCQ